MDHITRRNLMSCAAAITAAAATTLLSLAPAAADAVADFYKGKTVTVVVGYGTGGGYDVYARTIARHIGRFIPGQPAVVVQNMPGAGSLKAVNYIYNVAPKDGTIFAHFSPTMPMSAILGDNPSAKFDPRKFTWLGSSSSFAEDAYILMVRKDAPAKTIQEAVRPGGPTLLIGGSAPGSASNDVPVILRDTIGLNFKLVTGYPDSAALFLATERGEVHGRMVDLSGVKTIKPDWLKTDGDFRTLVQFGREKRAPALADVPTARELATTPEKRKLLELAEMPYMFPRPFAGPPGIPADRAKALQTAFMAVHRDPQFLQDAERLNIEISPIDHEAVLKAINSLASASPELKDELRLVFKSN